MNGDNIDPVLKEASKKVAKKQLKELHNDIDFGDIGDDLRICEDNIHILSLTEIDEIMDGADLNLYGAREFKACSKKLRKKIREAEAIVVKMRKYFTRMKHPQE